MTADGIEPIQPRSIRTAVRLMWVSAVLSLLSIALVLSRADSLKTDMRDRSNNGDQHLSPSAINFFADYVIVAVIFGAVVGFAFWAWLAWKNGQGRSWARILVSILGGLAVVQTPIGLAIGKNTPTSTALNVINLVLTLLIVVLLWRTESSEFYAASAAHKSGQVSG
jgi:hypothetical protein